MSKGEATRQRIVEQAATLFNQRGFEGSSMTALMDATGLEKGGIYRHFSGKEEIAAEAFDYAWRAASDARLQGLEEMPNSVDRLKKFMGNFVERSPVIPGGCPLFNTAVDSDDGNTVLRERARKALRGWLAVLSSTAQKGIATGEIRRDVDAGKLAILMISSLEGALVISRLERTREPLLAIQTYLNHYLDTAVRTGRIARRRAKKRRSTLTSKHDGPQH